MKMPGMFSAFAPTSLHGCLLLSGPVLIAVCEGLALLCKGAWLDLHPRRDLSARVLALLCEGAETSLHGCLILYARALIVASMGAETSLHPWGAGWFGAKCRGFEGNWGWSCRRVGDQAGKNRLAWFPAGTACQRWIGAAADCRISKCSEGDDLPNRRYLTQPPPTAAGDGKCLGGTSR